MLLRHGRLAAVILTCWFVGYAVGGTPVKPVAPATQPAESTEVETVWYDVHDLINYVPIDPGDKAEDVNGAGALWQIIRDQVDQDSWQDNGGSFGKMSEWCGDFIITQRSAAHAQIKELLAKLRALALGHETSITIDAYWIRLAPAQMAAKDSSISPAVLTDAIALYASARVVGFEGQRQTISLNRSVAAVTGVTPVVAPGVVVYDPTLSTKESDVVLSEIPRMVADGDVAISFDSKVTMQPEVASTNPTTRPTTEPSNAVSPLIINSSNEVAGSATAIIHARSIVRLKLGVPTIVSGMSDHPGAADNRTLCLVLCATVAK